MQIIEIIIYTTDAGKEPYSDWLTKLDKSMQAIIMQRLDRISLGNFGDAKLLLGTCGVWELRIDHGPGYRIYFGKEGASIVVLLMGGSKKSQAKDVTRAKHYWLNYKERIYYEKKLQNLPRKNIRRSARS